MSYPGALALLAVLLALRCGMSPLPAAAQVQLAPVQPARVPGAGDGTSAPTTPAGGDAANAPPRHGSAEAGLADGLLTDGLLTDGGLTGQRLAEGPLQATKMEGAGGELPGESAARGWTLGDFQLTPYGAFWGDMVYATRRTNPGAYSLWVESPDREGEPAYTVDIRRTRFGLNLDGPRLAPLGHAASRGRVEVDFHGTFVLENRATILLRHAYWEAEAAGFRLLVGQTWDIISPLQPGMVDYTPGYFAGNLGYRRAQFRGEKYWNFRPSARLAGQFSLNQDIVTDFPDEPGVHRESSDWPVLQGRLAIESTGDSEQSWQLGISGHLGETGFDFLIDGPPPLLLPPADDQRFLTWSLNMDARLPLGTRWGLQGELYMGSNLSAYLGGIGQGVCPCTRSSIRSRGGWLEAWFRWTREISLHAGGGLDDPIDRDIQFGRTYNHFLFANIQAQVTPQLSTGFEITTRKTLYHDTRIGQIPDEDLGPLRPGNALTFDWMLKYAF